MKSFYGWRSNLIFIFSKCSNSGLNKDVDAKKTKNRASLQLLLQSHFILAHLRPINLKLKLTEGTCCESSVYAMPA